MLGKFLDQHYSSNHDINWFKSSENGGARRINLFPDRRWDLAMCYVFEKVPTSVYIQCVVKLNVKQKILSGELSLSEDHVDCAGLNLATKHSL